MSIRPVSIITQNNYNCVSFESRRNKSGKHNQSNPVSHRLAVPTAALMLAMMPMNASPKYINDVESLNSIEYVEDAPKVVQRGTIQNASPKYGDCIMELMSADGGETGYMVMNFKDYTIFDDFVIEGAERKEVPMKKTVNYAVKVDSLKTVKKHIIDTGNRESVYPIYYVCGPASVLSIFSRDDGSEKIERTSTSKVQNMNIELTEECYNALKSFLGDRIPYKTEHKKEYMYNPLY